MHTPPWNIEPPPSATVWCRQLTTALDTAQAALATVAKLLATAPTLETPADAEAVLELRTRASLPGYQTSVGMARRAGESLVQPIAQAARTLAEPASEAMGRLEERLSAAAADGRLAPVLIALPPDSTGVMTVGSAFERNRETLGVAIRSRLPDGHPVLTLVPPDSPIGVGHPLIIRDGEYSPSWSTAPMIQTLSARLAQRQAEENSARQAVQQHARAEQQRQEAAERAAFAQSPAGREQRLRDLEAKLAALQAGSK